MGGVPLPRSMVRRCTPGGSTPVGGSPLVHPATAQPREISKLALGSFECLQVGNFGMHSEGFYDDGECAFCGSAGFVGGRAEPVRAPSTSPIPSFLEDGRRE